MLEPPDEALWTAHQEVLTQQALSHHRTSESSITLLFLRELSFVPSGHKWADLLTCTRTVLTIHVVSVRLSSIHRCHFVIGVNIYVTHFHKYRTTLTWCYLITGMLCLFSDGSVIPRAGGVSLSLGDNCWQLSEFVVIAVWHKDGMVLVLSPASHVQKQK